MSGEETYNSRDHGAIMNPPAYLEYGKPEKLQEMLGITTPIAVAMGGVVSFSAAIEYHLERYIWALLHIDPAGTRPPTDAKQITELLNMLADHIEVMDVTDGRKMLETWCRAARSAFKIRNDLVHGLPVKMEDSVTFNRNPAWHGETRKRPYSDFWADEHNTTLVRDGMAVLFRMIVELQTKRYKLEDLANMKTAMSAVRDAASILGELEDRMAYNPTFEKY